MSDDPNPNLPTPRQASRMRVPGSRHHATRVNSRLKARKAVNTVAMPWVDFGQDLAAILAGRSMRDGNVFRVNGREYVLEGDGRLIPVYGDGLYQLGRGAYRALGLYNSEGLMESVEAQLDRELILEDERRIARTVWLEIQAWRKVNP